MRIKSSYQKTPKINSPKPVINFKEFTEKEGLYIPENILFDLLTAQPDNIIAHIKDAKTGAYILCNPNTLKFYNLKESDGLIGCTIFDIDNAFMHNHWHDYADKVAKMEYQAINNQKIFLEQGDTTTDACDQIYILDTFKLPLVSRSNKVIAIMTVNIDSTPKTNLFNLLDLYKKKYTNRLIGLNHFVKYLGIADYFNADLTGQEIACLLHMRCNSSYKNVAKQLGISIRTVETHVYHIIQKIKKEQLSKVLSILRSR